jgi:ABC-type transporter Mla subunit MlaD
MSKFYSFLFICLLIFSTSVKLESKKKKKQKICTKLSRPIREIADMKAAIATIQEAINNKTLLNTVDEDLSDETEYLYQLYNESLANFTKRVAILDNSVPSSLLDQCKALYDTIDQSNESLDNFKNLTKTTLKTLKQLFKGDF